MAESTLTGILGREAVYSGQAITWDEAIKSKTKLGPGRVQVRSLPDPAGGHARAVQVHVSRNPRPASWDRIPGLSWIRLDR